MRVLVTGGSGFLGGWLARRLLAEGHGVRLICRGDRAPLARALPGTEVVPGDVTDATSLAAACRGIDTVFHLAGVVGHGAHARTEMERVNVGGTARVIDACAASGARLVHASSAVAVGASFDGHPLDEQARWTLASLRLGYFDTKHRAEELVLAAVRARRIEAVMINPTTIYGAGDAAKGSRTVQVAVARGRFPWVPPGGVGVVAVEDVVDAFLAVWCRGRVGERYLINGGNLTLRELFTAIARAAEVRPPWIPLPRAVLFGLGAVGDRLAAFGFDPPFTTETAWMAVLHHWFDGGRAERELGIRPRPPAAAITASVEWMRAAGLLGGRWGRRSSSAAAMMDVHS
jgi:dihydroflavonol-4-reductase